MATPDQVRDKSARAMTKFGLIALGVLIALGIVWFVAHAMTQPASRADATMVGDASSTTPPDAVNGGGVAGTGGAAPLSGGAAS